MSFTNPQNTGPSAPTNSPHWGPGQVYYNGLGVPDGPGHGHYNPNNQFNRHPVGDFLGNAAIRGAAGRPLGRLTPKW